MAELLEIPREKFHIVTIGIDSRDFSGLKRISGRPPTVGYFGRIAPEKGFARIVDAFIHLHSEHNLSKACLKAAGWLGENNREFFETQVGRIEAAGLGQNFNYTGAPNRQGKLEFFSSIDAFSLPTTCREPKGLPVLEALASGIPVVQPEHGIFPEMLSKTGGGILIAPGDSKVLAAALAKLLENPGKAEQLGEEGRTGVIGKCTGRHMANETLNIYRQFLES
jgi:glycosyltransferase involved in cell wall biosynthesis